MAKGKKKRARLIRNLEKRLVVVEDDVNTYDAGPSAAELIDRLKRSEKAVRILTTQVQDLSQYVANHAKLIVSTQGRVTRLEESNALLVKSIVALDKRLSAMERREDVDLPPEALDYPAETQETIAS